MSFLRPFQWYHSQADPIWPDGTFKVAYNDIDSAESEVRFQDGGGHCATQSWTMQNKADSKNSLPLPLLNRRFRMWSIVYMTA